MMALPGNAPYTLLAGTLVRVPANSFFPPCMG